MPIMATTSKSVFILGPGFIGLNVLNLLVADGYHVSALVHGSEYASHIAASSATPILGDLNDRDLIIKHVLENDITIHTAGADHLASVLAVLDGFSQRTEAGKEALYIHTSGTSVLCSTFTSTHEWRDTRPDAIHAIPQGSMHRHIDLAIVAAQQGTLGDKAKIAIMMPPDVYGVNPRHERLGLQIPALTRFALKHGFAGYVDDGRGLWSCIHVLDLARGYVTLLNHLLASDKPLKNPFWFCENGTEFSWREAAQCIGKALHEKGLLEDAEPRQIGPQYYGELFGEWTDACLGMDSRSRAVRLRKLGWESREKGVWESFLEDELPVLLGEGKEGNEVGGE
jgi:nucleoside-diphosphate-sugar epimerase